MPAICNSQGPPVAPTRESWRFFWRNTKRNHQDHRQSPNCASAQNMVQLVVPLSRDSREMCQAPGVVAGQGRVVVSVVDSHCRHLDQVSKRVPGWFMRKELDSPIAGCPQCCRFVYFPSSGTLRYHLVDPIQCDRVLVFNRVSLLTRNSGSR